MISHYVNLMSKFVRDNLYASKTEENHEFALSATQKNK